MSLVVFPRQFVVDISGIPRVGAKLYVYNAGTTTAHASYTTPALTIAHASPILSLSNGFFPAVYVNPDDGNYKLVVKDASDVTIYSEDDQAPLDLSYIGVANYLNGQTTQELALGVTPSDKRYLTGDVRRYGYVGDGVHDDTTAIQTAINVWANGGAYPYLPGGTAKTSAEITIPQRLTLDLNNTTIKPSGTANAFTLTHSSVGIKNGYIDLTTTTGKGIYSTGAQQQLTFRDLHFTCGAGTGIELVDAYAVRSDNLRLDSGSGRAVYLRSSIAGTTTNSQVWANCSIANFTIATDIFTVEGASGIIIENLDSENHAASAVDLRITANALVNTTNVEVRGGYFETGPSIAGTLIKVDVGAGSSVSGVKISRLYTLTSKQPVLVSGSGVGDDLEVTGNTFQTATGAPTYAVSVPASFVPNCHSNNGSQQDINRTFTPALKFGGASSGMTGTFTGRATRVGNRIHGEFQITLTAKGASTGNVTVEGLPKASYSLSTNNQVGVNFCSGMASLTSVPIGRIGTSATSFALSEFGATGTIELNQANFTDSSVVYGNFGYEVEG